MPDRPFPFQPPRPVPTPVPPTSEPQKPMSIPPSIPAPTADQQIADLQNRVAALENKTPFYEMDILTLVADESCLTAEQNPGWYLPQIKINHPLANNNPNAVFFVQAMGLEAMNQPQSLFFQYLDGAWYLKMPSFVVDSGLQYKVGRNGYDEPALMDLPFDDYLKQGGFGHGMQYTPRVGDTYSILIFRRAPDLRQTITPSQTLEPNPPPVNP